MATYRSKTIRPKTAAMLSAILLFALIAILMTTTRTSKPQLRAIPTTTLQSTTTVPELHLPYCEHQEPQFSGAESVSCTYKKIQITFEKYDGLDQLIEIKNQYLLEPLDYELNKYRRTGISDASSRIMTIDKENLLLVNIESETHDVDSVEQWIDTLELY